MTVTQVCILKTSAITLILSLLLILLILNSKESYAKSDNTKLETLYIGVEINRRPFSWKTKSGAVEGLLVDWFEVLCKNLERRCEFIPKYFNEMETALYAYHVDIVAVIDQRVNTEQGSLRLSYKYCDLKPRFISNKKLDLENMLKQEKKPLVGVLKPSLFIDYLHSAQNDKFHIRPYAIIEAALFDLATDRIDLVFADERTLNHRLRNQSIGENFEFIGNVIEDPISFNYGMKFMVRSNDDELLYQLDREVFALYENATCDKPRQDDFIYKNTTH